MNHRTIMLLCGNKVPKYNNKEIIQCDCGKTVSRGRFQNHIWTKAHTKRGFLTSEEYIERYIDPEPGSEWYELKVKESVALRPGRQRAKRVSEPHLPQPGE